MESGVSETQMCQQHDSLLKVKCGLKIKEWGPWLCAPCPLAAAPAAIRRSSKANTSHSTHRMSNLGLSPLSSACTVVQIWHEALEYFKTHRQKQCDHF